MKTFHKHFAIKHQKPIAALVVVLILLGMTVKSHGQSPVLGNDFENINSSMKIQLNNHDFDVLVPKVEKHNLKKLEDVYFNHMVYVTDDNPGFYMFLNNHWEKQSVRELFAVIDMHINMSEPGLQDIILQTSEAENRVLLDYNGHISHLYSHFTFEQDSNQLAIVLK